MDDIGIGGECPEGLKPDAMCSAKVMNLTVIMRLSVETVL